MITLPKDPGLEAGWRAAVGARLAHPPLPALRDFLLARKQAGATIYPAGPNIFKALNTTPWDRVRAVILGQDPYHGPGQAHGLCFSVPAGVPCPPSLENIFKELSADLGLPRPATGDLTPWAAQGVLLLNSVLTVEAGQPASHAGQGWEAFTDHIIHTLSQQKQHLVFMLWGSYAQAKQALIDPTRHCILQAPHPSPLSAHRGFFGCGHFSQANHYWQRHGLPPLNWALPA